MRRVLILVAFLMLAAGAPAQAGEGLRVVEVPGDPCPSVRVVNGGQVVWERALATPWVDESQEGVRCGNLDGVWIHRGGVYFRYWLVTGPYLHHSDGTGVGTRELFPSDPDDTASATMTLYRGRLFFAAPLGRLGWEVYSVGPAGDVRLLRDIRKGPKGSGPWDRRMHVRSGKLRFLATDGTGRRWWVSDGTRKGTHVVRR